MTAEMPLRLAAHLAKAVHESRRRYRKRLARCQKKTSEKAVHELRVETRRVLALLDLLGTLGYPESLDKICRSFKKRLKCFGELRDTQVQLQLLRPLWPKFPEAESLKTLLQRHEKKLAAKLKGEVKAARSSGLNRQLKEVEKCVAQRGRPHGLAADTAVAALTKSFERVEQLRAEVRPGNIATIHQFRIGVKRFRYMCELLQPLLPRVLTEAQLERLKHLQDAAGAIQDLEVLRQRLGQCVQQRRLNPIAIRNLRGELSQRRMQAIDSFLKRIEEISRFRTVIESASNHEPKPHA